MPRGTVPLTALPDGVCDAIVDIKEVVIMPDILIRDVSEVTVAEIDRRAKAQGLSRTEYLRRHLLSEYRPPQPPITRADWERSMKAMADLGDPEIMAAAWR